MPTRVLVLCKMQKDHKWVKLSTGDKRLIKGKIKGNNVYRTGLICAPNPKELNSRYVKVVPLGLSGNV